MDRSPNAPTRQRECVNIGTMEERVEGRSVFLTLVPRPGAQIDPGGIETCLRDLLAGQAGARSQEVRLCAISSASSPTLE